MIIKKKEEIRSFVDSGRTCGEAKINKIDKWFEFEFNKEKKKENDFDGI